MKFYPVDMLVLSGYLQNPEIIYSGNGGKTQCFSSGKLTFKQDTVREKGNKK